MTDEPTAVRGPQRGPAWADLGVAVGVVALGAIAAWQTTSIPQSAYAAVGPRAFAWVASAMMLIMGAFLVVDALRGGWSHETDDFGEVDWRGGLWMVGALAANALLIDLDMSPIATFVISNVGGTDLVEKLNPSGVGPVGFIIASTVLFTLTARAFNSTRLARDAAIGFALTVVAYVGFDRVLGYKIGTGIIERLI
jgi:putative tricarboxylic transport membrane protein